MRPDKKSELKIYGRNACEALFKERAEQIRKVYLKKELRKELEALLNFCAKKKVGFSFVSEEELEKITESKHHQGICCIRAKTELISQEKILEPLEKERGPLCIVLLEGVENPHNLGAILRSAASFGCRALLLTADTKISLSSAVYRTAEGGAEFVPIGILSNLEKFFAWARSHKFSICATSPHAKSSLSEIKFSDRSVLIFGREESGLSKKILESADRVLSIPGTKNVESLNLAVSAAVVLWEFFRQQR